MEPNDGLTRRQILGASGIAVASGLAGCSSLIGGGGMDKIKYWNVHNGNDYRPTINEITSDFEADHPADVKVRYVNNDSTAEAFSSAIATDTLPALGMFAPQTIHRMGSDGALSADASTAVVEAIGEDNFLESPLNLMSAPDGGYRGVPVDAWVQGMWYRESAFEEAGLDKPITWEAIREAAKTFHDPENDQYGVGFGTKVVAYTTQCFTQFAKSNGANVFNENGEIIFDSPEMVEALAFVKELGNYIPGAISYKDTRNLYGNKQLNMFLYSSYLLPDLLEHDGKEAVKDTGLAPATKHTRESTYGAVLGHMIFDGSDSQVKASKNLNKFIMSPDQYVKWVLMQPGGTLPVLKSTSEREAYRSNDIISAWGDTIEQITSALGNIDRFDFVNGNIITQYSEVSSRRLIAEAVNRVVIGREDPQTVANEQAEKMRQALK